MAVVKKVKSKADLNSMAMSSGATVIDNNGRKFNSAQSRTKPIKRLEPNPDAQKIEPTPIPPPVPKADPGSILVAEKIEAAAKGNAMMIAELKHQLSQVSFHAEKPIMEWTFDMIRDDKGYLTQVRAHAEVINPTLN